MKTGGHIKPCKVGQVEAHNRRDPAYVERMANSKHPLHFYPHLACRENVDVFESKYSDRFNSVKGIFDAMIVRYQEMDKRHRKPPLKDRERIDKKTGKKVVVSGWSPIREMVVVIKSDTTIGELQKFSAWLKAEKGVNTIFSSLHFDEGHIGKKDKKFHCNFHAHLGLDFFNWKTGKTIKLDKKDMSDIQTALAECLGMERGEIKEITEEEHRDVVEYRMQAEENSIRQEHQERIKKSEQEAIAICQEHQERIKKSAKEVEKMEAKKAELDKQVGAGAQFKAFFGVGKLAQIYSELKKAKENEAKAVKDKETAQKALKDANESHGKELATAREESRQRGISDTIKAIKDVANLHITGKDGKETAEDIGKNWRWNFDQRKQLQSKVEKMEAEKKQLQSHDPYEQLNKVLRHFHISTLNTEDVEKAAAVIDRSYLGGWNAPARNDFCDAVIAWGRQKRELSNNPSPKALQTLRKLFEAMVEAWNYLMRVVRAPFKGGTLSPGEAAELARYSFTPAAVMKEVQLQLELTPGAAECSDGWQEALKQTPEQFLAPYQSLVKLHSDIEQEQHDQEQHIEEEEEVKRTWGSKR